MGIKNEYLRLGKGKRQMGSLTYRLDASRKKKKKVRSTALRFVQGWFR